MFKNIVAVVLIVIGVAGSGLVKLPLPTPKPEPIAILNIEKPSQDVIDRVQKFSSLVKDPTDRAKIAIFNYEFATKVVGYEANLQQVNDVYTLAGKTFFKNSIVGKYSGLSDMLVELLTQVAGDKNHILNEKEKSDIHDNFMGIAWVLIQKE
jgi:hypothetical protein